MTSFSAGAADYPARPLPVPLPSAARHFCSPRPDESAAGLRPDTRECYSCLCSGVRSTAHSDMHSLRSPSYQMSVPSSYSPRPAAPTQAEAAHKIYTPAPGQVLTIFQMCIKRFYLLGCQIYERRIVEHKHCHVAHSGRYCLPFRNEFFHHGHRSFAFQQFIKRRF